MDPARRNALSPHPAIFCVLNMPRGLTGGYLTVVVPFLITRAGFSVLTAASVVAISLSPKVWKVLWAPLADMGLTLKKWYVIGVTIAGGLLIAQSILPVGVRTLPLITAALFLAECGSNMLAPSLGGLMANAVPDEQKGRTAAWYQIGGKVGTGIGGGVGLWLAIKTHTAFAAGSILGAGCIACAIVLRVLVEPPRVLSSHLLARLKDSASDLWALLRSKRGLLVAFFAISPIGVSGVDDFWSAIAPEWGASPRMIVLVTGFSAAAISCAGCLMCGWWADRSDRRRVYLLTGAFVALCGGVLAAAPHVPVVFVAGSLVQKFSIGMADAAMYVLFLDVIGRSASAGTQFTVLAALGNLGELYMTVMSAWMHDHRGSTAMLGFESAIGMVFVIAAALLLKAVLRTPKAEASVALGG